MKALILARTVLGPVIGARNRSGSSWMSMSISPSSWTRTLVRDLRALCHNAICSRRGSMAAGEACLNAHASCGLVWVS